MTNLKINTGQRKPFHARQVTRLIGVAFTKAGWMSQEDQDLAMSLEDIPAMMITTPDGREFLIRVEEV